MLEEDVMAKKKKSFKAKPKISKKRAQEIESTFKALSITSSKQYYGSEQFGNQFQRVSIYENNGYTFFTSNGSCG